MVVKRETIQYSTLHMQKYCWKQLRETCISRNELSENNCPIGWWKSGVIIVNNSCVRNPMVLFYPYGFAYKYIYIYRYLFQRNYYGSHGDVISSRNVKWNSDLLIPFETLKLEPVIIKYSLLQPGTCYKNSIMRTLIYRSKRNNGKRFSVTCLHTEGHIQLSRNHLAEC